MNILIRLAIVTTVAIYAVIAFPWPNGGWSLDFLHDTLLSRRWFRALNIMDDFTREQLARAGLLISEWPSDSGA